MEASLITNGRDFSHFSVNKIFFKGGSFSFFGVGWGGGGGTSGFPYFRLS